MSNEKFTVAVAVNSQETLTNNLYRSPELLAGGNQILIKQNYKSASLAYNSALDEAQNDVVIFVHQDIYFPEGWFADLRTSLSYLEREGRNWGVLGSFGSSRMVHGGVGRVYTTGLGLHGNRIDKPEPVDTLDEIVLVLRKSSGLRFDPDFPHFHLYGTDICMSASLQGMTNYAIPGFCVHNTNQLLTLPPEFYDCYSHIKRKWRKYLPIYASCATISLFEADLYVKRIRELTDKLIGNKRLAKRRVDDPRVVLENCGEQHQRQSTRKN